MGMRASGSIELNVNFISRVTNDFCLDDPCQYPEPGKCTINFTAGTKFYKELKTALSNDMFDGYHGERKDHMIYLCWTFMLIWDSAYDEYKHKCWDEAEASWEPTEESSQCEYMDLGTKKAESTFELVFI